MSSDTTLDIAVQNALKLERAMAAKALALKTAQQEIDDTWAAVKDAMIKNNVKSVKGDFGSITIGERTTFKVDDIDVLPDKFKKVVPDTKKIGTYHALTDELPEGTEAVVTQYLTKRLK